MARARTVHVIGALSATGNCAKAVENCDNFARSHGDHDHMEIDRDMTVLARDSARLRETSPRSKEMIRHVARAKACRKVINESEQANPLGSLCKG
eukprot:6018409-Pleurochrysis_carterae.AAC.1